jgi:hypothetical protein
LPLLLRQQAAGKQPMKPYVAAAMERIGETLDAKKQSSAQALQCLGYLAEAMGSEILVTVSTTELLGTQDTHLAMSYAVLIVCLTHLACALVSTHSQDVLLRVDEQPYRLLATFGRQSELAAAAHSRGDLF